MGLVGSALKDRWLYVTSGPLAGKQFILYKPQTIMGAPVERHLSLQGCRNPAAPRHSHGERRTHPPHLRGPRLRPSRGLRRSQLLRGKGIYVTAEGEILECDTHVLEVHLSLEYPRRAPKYRMLTSVFHPNFDDASACIGDSWAASEGLDDLIVRIGLMIAYQEYNTCSPLNGLAAKWAAEHLNLLPIDSTIVAPSAEATAVTEQFAAQTQFRSITDQPSPHPMGRKDPDVIVRLRGAVSEGMGCARIW
jgi:ubiquitin-protein ligase